MVLFNKFKMENSFKGYKFFEVYYIECIGRNVDFNVIKFVEFFYMIRGVISKIVKKFIEKGIIESY